MRSKRQAAETISDVAFHCLLVILIFTTIFKSFAIKQQNNCVNWKQKILHV